MSGRHLRHLIRPYLQAGWTVADLHYALDHTPDGAEHRYAYRADELHHPAGWIAWRLRHWLDEDGAVRPGHHRPASGPTGSDPAGEVGEPPAVPVDSDELAAARAALTARLTAATNGRRARQAEQTRRAEQVAAAHHQAALAALPEQSAAGTAVEREARVRAAALARARADRAARTAGQADRPTAGSGSGAAASGGR